MGMYNKVKLSECIDISDMEEVFYETREHSLDPQLERDTLAKLYLDKKSFVITPPFDARIGIVVRFQNTLDTSFFNSKPIVPEIRFGNNNWRKDSIRALVAKAQMGIYAMVTGYDICANCRIDGFELILVTASGTKACFNEGGNFSSEARAIMHTIKPGDLLVFRNIKYQCYNGYPLKRARDLLFTIL